MLSFLAMFTSISKIRNVLILNMLYKIWLLIIILKIWIYSRNNLVTYLIIGLYYILYIFFQLDEAIPNLSITEEPARGYRRTSPNFPHPFSTPSPHYPSTFNCYELAGPDLHDVGVVSYRRRCDIMTSHGRRFGLCFVLLLMDRSTSIELNLTFP